MRQPLAAVAFSLPAAQAGTVRRSAELIADELNVKAVEVLDDDAGVVTYRLNPLPQELGPRFGKAFPKLQKLLRESDARPYAGRLLAGETITVSLDGEEATLTPAEVEVQLNPSEGYAIAQENQLLAALSVTLTDDLLAEGLAREFIRRVQTLRRDADYNVDDRIEVGYRASGRLAAAVEQFAATIKNETLALALRAERQPAGDQSGKYEFDGETLVVAVRRPAG